MRTRDGAAVARPRAAFAWVRREEWLLVGLWAFGVALCLWSGTGFHVGAPLEQYLRFFSLEIVYVFAGSRVLFHLASRWRPERPTARWLARVLFGIRGGGEPDPRASVMAIDLELVRGTILLFVTLVVYSNVKQRIPIFGSPVDGDAMFRDLDALILPDALVPAIEAWFRGSGTVVEVFQGVYVHDYKYMVVIVFLLYMRRDAFHLRWVFVAVCATYLVAIFVAAALPSYGPCFLSERFVWLQAFNVGRVQTWLGASHNAIMTAYARGADLPIQAFVGIAAFPSLHVGHMVILGVIGLRVCRPFAALMLVVGLGTFVATIGFGWHYVVDAFGGVALAVWITRALHVRMRRWDARATAAASG